MNILSLFGGIECGRVALDRLGIPVDKYFSSEIDPYAIKITQANYPDIVHIGDVQHVWMINEKLLRYGSLNDWWYCWVDDIIIDLLIWWSPCQDLSIAKASWKGLDWEKSGLFYEYVRILKEVRPKYFILENVASMKSADKEKITEVLREVYPDTEVHMINSSLVSAQNRKRLYWTNIPWVTQPEDKWILLRDILEDIPMDDERWKPLDEKYLTDKVKLQLKEKSLAITASYHKKNAQNYFEKSDGQIVLWQFRRWAHLRIHADQENAPTLTSNMGTGGNNVPVLINSEYYWRKLTPTECERLQTLPDWYTAHVSDSRRYKAIGNGWTVDVISHILSFIPR